MNDHLHALPPGHQLNEYRIERVIGTGGFGITYYAWDTHLDKEVAIKEYLPNEFALRADGTTVRPKSSSDQGNYQWGLDRFLDEARTLARFDHPYLNKVSRFFKDNGTAYMVLEYIEGETLSQLLHREGRLDPTRLQRLIGELLSGIEEIHQAGFVHRDIKPGNIMLREDGSAVLLDFGAARQAIGQRSKAITSVLTPGYAPIEQYSQKADRVGPWTDLYALGMVLYRCISGVSDGELVDAAERMGTQRRGEQDMARAVEAGKGRYDESLLKAVDWAIKVNEEDRPQSVSVFRAALTGSGISADAADEKPVTGTARPPRHEKGKAGSGKQGVLLWVLAAIAGVAMVAVASVVVWPLIKESIYWSDVQCGEESDVRAYQEKYPGGRYEQEAGECLAAIEADKAQLAAQAKAEEEAKAKAAAEAKAKAAAEEKAIEEAKAEARASIAESAYWSVVQCDKELAVRAYLEKYPGGQYQQEAEACLVAIEATEIAAAEAEMATDAWKFQDAVGRTASPHTVDDNGWTDLHYAAALNLPELAGELLKSGASVDARLKDDGEFLTHELRQILWDPGKDFNQVRRNGETPLHIAARGNAHEVAALLIEKGADIYSRGFSGWTPLHLTAVTNAREVAALLIDKGADINTKDDSGRTPLNTADAYEVAVLLIEKGADINAKDDSGWTPSHHAARKSALKIVALLIEKGADINIQSDFDEGTPLHWAARANSHEVVALLIDKGADINAKRNDGSTPLHQAASGNAHEVVALLVDKGADINAKDKYGYTPLDEAKLLKAHEVIRLLE